MEQATGASFTPVFHNDSALALNTLLGGNIDAVQGSVGDFVAQVKAGRVRMLAVFDRQESAYAPGVPTAASQGFAINTGTSRGFAFPAGVDPKMAARIGEALGKVANSRREQGQVLRDGPRDPLHGRRPVQHLLEQRGHAHRRPPGQDQVTTCDGDRIAAVPVPILEREGFRA